MQIGDYYFPCSIAVLENPELGFLLGLGMMKRHTCGLDLEKSALKFRLSHTTAPGDGDYLEAPFLHEKDLPESKGGTKGFDAAAANKKILETDKEENETNGNGGGDESTK